MCMYTIYINKHVRTVYTSIYTKVYTCILSIYIYIYSCIYIYIAIADLLCPAGPCFGSTTSVTPQKVL